MYKNYYKLAFIFFIIVFGSAKTQEIRINEIVSSNGDNLYDEDNDTPDWIELHNPTNQTIDLLGYCITDDPDDLSKWSFPSIQVEPNAFLVLFASDKDRKNYVVQWDAKIDWGDSWNYWIGNSAPTTDWELPETDISFWPIGPSGFGYGDGDDNTEIEQAISVYVKKEFYIPDSSKVKKALFHLDYDDGYIAYLNGVEFSRQNLGAMGSPVYYFTTTTGLHEAEIYNGGSPEMLVIDLALFPLKTGSNTLAIEVHNYSNTSSDLSCIPFLTLGYDTEFDDFREPNEIIDIPESYLHTNFKLSSDGESIFLSDSNEIIQDSIITGPIQTNMSYGRYLESNSWNLFNEPTPWYSNTTNPSLGALIPPVSSHESGFYTGEQNGISVQLSSTNTAGNIYYTLDGSIPTDNDAIYNSSIIINSNTVLRARSILDDWVPSPIISKTFIFDNDPSDNLPTIFISTDPNSFFNEDTGMYAFGPNADWNFPYFGSNFWEDWERPIHFEILEIDGSGYAANAGAKIFGGWSRGFPQKSLSIFSRSHIGPSSFEYQLFPDSDIDNYEAFVIRNSGNDWESTMLRDGFITSLADNLDIDHQRYRPAILYINGQFWGIQNLREKVNEHFLSSNHSIDPEHIDLLDLSGMNNENIIHGTNIDYQNLINYLETQDVTDPIVENAIENWIDIDSYMSYQAFQIFIDNRDWPGNNIKFWRDHRPGGKWRWILYDTDFGFSIWDPNAYYYNTLEYALDPNGPDWPNPPWSTFIFRKLLENENFRNRFINIYCDFLNTVFQPNSLQDHLEMVSSKIENTIPEHRDRWYNNGNWPNSVINWESNINNMENFASERRIRVIGQIRDQFNLSSMNMITLNVMPYNAGNIQINTLNINQDNWSGFYFPTAPIRLAAIQNEGYQFSHWQQFPDSSSSMTLNLTNSMVLTAVFNHTNLSPGTVVINEINYNSNNDHESGDWIELYNSGEMAIDISDWRLKDDDNNHIYNIPEETIIDSEDYLVIAQDLNQFHEFYSTEIYTIGPFDFGFGGGGDQVRIFNNIGELIDSVEYDDVAPWASEADGDGPTLELINPELDNSLPESWAASEEHGTPGELNSTFNILESNEKTFYPDKIELYSSSPNPFNPATTISFDVPHNEKRYNIRLQVFNLKGQLVQTILNSDLSSGRHNITWAPKNISSGIYILRLASKSDVINQKITYLK